MLSSFRSAVSVYKFVFCSYFLFFNNSKKLHQKETLSELLSCLWILQSFSNFITEHLRTAVSETVTENSLRSSARTVKLHIISPIELWLGSKWASAQRLIMKSSMKNGENKAMLKC